MYLCTKGIDFASFYDFSTGLWNCSDSVALFVFLCDFGTVPTVWHYLFFYWTLELFRQCGIICFPIGHWNCSDSVALFAFLLDIGTVPTVWHYLLFYWTLELFRQCGIICFSIGHWNCSDSVAPITSSVIVRYVLQCSLHFRVFMLTRYSIRLYSNLFCSGSFCNCAICFYLPISVSNTISV